MRSLRPQRLRLASAVIAAWLGVVVLALATLAYLPGLHRAMHTDFGSECAADPAVEHACAITLFAQGVESAGAAALVVGPEWVPSGDVWMAERAETSPACAHLHPPGQGPPSGRIV